MQFMIIYRFGAFFGYGNDLHFKNNFFNNNSNIYFPYTYQDSIGKGRSIFTGDTNNSNAYFKIKEVEVFKLYK